MNHGFRLFPEAASTVAHGVDCVTLGLLLLSGLILIVVFGLVIAFAILYREGSARSRVISERGQNKLEWSWTFATFFAFLGLFAWGAVLYLRMHEPPPGSTEILVVAKQWMWKFQHPDGRREINELHVPIGQPILLTMTSQDVIHSLFVPAFRLKQDILPNRYVHAWFQATKAGVFHLFCTQYCGTMHANMGGTVFTMKPADYQRWLASGLAPSLTLSRDESSASRGSRIFTRFGCISCHGNNPSVVAPTLAGIYGKYTPLNDGTTVLVDENYLRECILRPNTRTVMGFQPIMPSFAGIASEEDVIDLIAYIKSLAATPTSQAPVNAP